MKKIDASVESTTSFSDSSTSSGSITDKEKYTLDASHHDSNSLSNVPVSLATDMDDFEIQRIETRKTILNQITENAPCNEDFEFTPSTMNFENSGEEFMNIDPELVAWKSGSEEDPRNWSKFKKIWVVLLVSLYTFVCPLSASILSPATAEIGEEFGVRSPVVCALFVSIHLLAWAIGPLFVAPFSENYKFGRKIVLSITCWLTCVLNLSCGFTKTTTQLILLRFICGLFSSTALNVSPAVISDMYSSKERNVSLAGVFLIPLLGAALSPVIGAYVVQAAGWRWVVYTLAIINGVIAFVNSFLFCETYAPKLLYVKAQKLRKESGNPNLHTIYELCGAKSMFSAKSMCRPVVLLFTNPLVFGLGSFMAFIYGFLYLMIVTFPSVFQKTYGFSRSVSGLMYLSLGCGFMLGVVFWTFLLGKVYERLTQNNGGIPKPEYRLPCLFVTALIIPIGLFWYGWSAQYKLHWIMPCIGSGIFAFGLVCVLQVLQAYLIDMNPAYAASSIAASSIFRCLLGFSFPLFANMMYEGMGYGWGNTLCGIVSLLLGIPFPFVCYKYGERLREWSNARII